jgi:BON domain
LSKNFAKPLILASVKTRLYFGVDIQMTKSRVQLQGFSSIEFLSETCDSQFPLQTMTYSLLSKIPPERVGLKGEYDHSGLAKRVSKAFESDFSANELEDVRVTQRGKVVVLSGTVRSDRVLNRLTSIALRVEGAIEVETTGIRLR